MDRSAKAYAEWCPIGKNRKRPTTFLFTDVARQGRVQGISPEGDMEIDPHSHSQKRSAKEARKETNVYLIGTYGSLRSRSLSKERRKGVSEGTTTVRYSKILTLAVDGVPEDD
jgi:hypothetical protein